MRTLAIGTLAVSAISVVACTQVNSADLKTAGMSAQMSVTADGSGKSQVVAALFVDNNVTDRVSLNTGDGLSVSGGGQSALLQRDNTLSILTYDATLAVDAAGTTFTIAFTRANDTSAPNSACTLPDAFSPTGPSGAKSRANDDIVITWMPSAAKDPMTWIASGSCLDAQSSQGIAGDPGTLTIPKGKLASAMQTSTCDVTISITRTRAGTLDKAYGYGGSINAAQARSVKFSSTM
jgi:hypothetical protein